MTVSGSIKLLDGAEDQVDVVGNTLIEKRLHFCLRGNFLLTSIVTFGLVSG